MIYLEYIILLLPLLWEAATDYYRIEVRGLDDNHTEDIWVRIGVCVVSGILCRYIFDKNAIQGFIYSGCLFIAFFDPLLNILRGKNFFHKGTNPTDQFILNHLPRHAEIFVRCWVLLVGYAFYYDWELIFSHGKYN